MHDGEEKKKKVGKLRNQKGVNFKWPKGRVIEQGACKKDWPGWNLGQTPELKKGEPSVERDVGEELLRSKNDGVGRETFLAQWTTQSGATGIEGRTGLMGHSRKGEEKGY